MHQDRKDSIYCVLRIPSERAFIWAVHGRYRFRLIHTRCCGLLIPQRDKKLSTCIFSIIYQTVSIWLKKLKKSTQKLTNYWDSEISELKIFCFSNFCKISRKIRNFATKMKQIFFTTEDQIISTLRRNFYFFVPYRWSTNLEILQVLIKNSYLFLDAFHWRIHKSV